METPAQTVGPFRILIDGECALCSKEGAMLRALDKGRGRLEVVDITEPGFDPAEIGVSFEDVMGKIHGVESDGSVITGMEVFRRAYTRVGWGWLWAPTGWPVLRWVFDAGYRWFGKNRYWLTGRKNPCEGDRCRVAGS